MSGSQQQYPSLVRDIRVFLEDDIGRFLVDLTDGRTVPLTSGELLSKALRAFAVLGEKLKTDSLDCAVLALAKSGKSFDQPDECRGYVSRPVWCLDFPVLYGSSKDICIGHYSLRSLTEKSSTTECCRE